MNASTRQHTPGPWTVRISQNGALRGYSIEHQDETLRSIVARNWEHELCEEHGNSLPNARLIASAPELLSALESIAALEPSIMSRQAEEGFRYHTEEDDYRIHLAGLINQARAIARAAIARATEGGAL